MTAARAPSDPARAARVQAWNATQWLARLAHSYAPQPKLTLRWDAAAARIVTPDLVPGTAVGLILPTLVLQFDEDGRPVPHPLELDDKSSSEVEAWILVELLHRDIARARFSKALPYKALPYATDELMSGEEPKYAAHDLADELGRYAAALASASESLARAGELLGAGSGLVVWPDTMEIGFAVPGVGDDRPIKVTYAAGGAEASGFRVVRAGADASIPALNEGATWDEIGRGLAELVTRTRH